MVASDQAGSQGWRKRRRFLHHSTCNQRCRRRGRVPVSVILLPRGDPLARLRLTWSATQAEKVESAGVAAMLIATVVSNSLHSCGSRMPRRSAMPNATNANSPPCSSKHNNHGNRQHRRKKRWTGRPGGNAGRGADGGDVGGRGGRECVRRGKSGYRERQRSQ